MTTNSMTYQVDGQTTNDSALEPYLNLWRAVMHEGLTSAVTQHRQWEQLRTPIHQNSYEALRWMNNEDDGVGTWRWLCELFDLDGNKARDAWFARQG